MLLRHDAAAAADHLGAMQAAGRPEEDLILDVLAPAARLLGHFWATDACDFVTVTLGMLHLRRLHHGLAPRFLAGAEESHLHRALIVPVPGEQHVFGLGIVADFFRHAGWQADVSPPRSVDELAATLRREAYSVIGISVGTTDRLDGLARTIRKLRRVSCNPRIGVMVGGPAFLGHPEYAALVGADATAADAKAAPRQAAALVRLLTQRD